LEKVEKVEKVEKDSMGTLDEFQLSKVFSLQFRHGMTEFRRGKKPSL
jgi:hypothetical protein